MSCITYVDSGNPLFLKAFNEQVGNQNQSIFQSRTKNTDLRQKGGERRESLLYCSGLVIAEDDEDNSDGGAVTGYCTTYFLTLQCPEE